MNKEFRVTFKPSGRSVFVLPGTVLLEAAGQAGLIIETPCGGAGKCGKCIVRIVSKDCPPTSTERGKLSASQLKQGYRLACHCRVTANLTVEIPESLLFRAKHKILTTSAGRRIAVKSRTSKEFLTHRPAGRHKSRTCSTVVRVDDRIVSVEKGNTTKQLYGVAFDVGTTTIVGTLIDLLTGEDLGVGTAVNPQTSVGDDVISRIKICREEKDGLARLQAMVLKAVNSIIGRLLRRAKVKKEHVYEAVFAGNTAMQEILLGINPKALGEIPFSAAFNDAMSMNADKAGVDINPKGLVRVFPQIGGFIGGDTVAGIIATRLDRSSKPTLLVDVGTNGEIVLHDKGKLMATSVAAGPAFEGARIINGMRGTTGAIEKVMVADGDIHFNIIGNTKPAGICGSGLIDIAAELLRLGVIDSTGRIQDLEEVPDNVSPAIRRRIVKHGEQNSVLLVAAKESSTGRPIHLYQKDVRELQLANAAIRAGINILLRTAGLDISDLGSVLLAGAFGNFIRRSNARRIGMLPPIPCERIRFVGNTSSLGARLLLLSTAEEKYAAKVTKTTRHVDLSLDPAFQEEFSSAMLFPEGE